ncbi:MAG: phage holin family protein [Propionibacteriaceae bacterium]|nr:phage holin family protein [Propionibacteriaceae bacterium]
MAQPEIGDVLNDITADVQTIIKGEIELAKAELMPQAKKAGIGAGLFGAAGYLAVQAATLLFICGGLALSALYQGVVSTIWAFTLGFLTMAVILLVIAGILVLVGKNKFDLQGPDRTVEQANRSISAVTGAINQGNANVKAIVAGAPLPVTAVTPGDQPLSR